MTLWSRTWRPSGSGMSSGDTVTQCNQRVHQYVYEVLVVHDVCAKNEIGQVAVAVSLNGRHKLRSAGRVAPCERAGDARYSWRRTVCAGAWMCSGMERGCNGPGIAVQVES